MFYIYQTDEGSHHSEELDDTRDYIFAPCVTLPALKIKHMATPSLSLDVTRLCLYIQTCIRSL